LHILSKNTKSASPAFVCSNITNIIPRRLTQIS
jgi:hypothetical protein